jgi:hypothetical protein
MTFKEQGLKGPPPDNNKPNSNKASTKLTPMDKLLKQAQQPWSPNPNIDKVLKTSAIEWAAATLGAFRQPSAQRRTVFTAKPNDAGH